MTLGRVGLGQIYVTNCLHTIDDWIFPVAKINHKSKLHRVKQEGKGISNNLVFRFISHASYVLPWLNILSSLRR